MEQNRSHFEVCSLTSGVLWVSSLVVVLLAARELPAELMFTGVNLAGADFGEGNLPGNFGQHYTYPIPAEVDYYVGKGANTFRIPFRWERLQRTLNGALDSTELARLSNIVNYATSQGASVVLDPHNYARYHGNVIGGGNVSNADFGDFWSRVANEFKDNDRVIFGLMNEPNSMPTEQWGSAANSAIQSIRNTGAGNLILVPGNAWTGAHSWTQNWYGTPNSTVMLSITDPADNFAFDVHQYLDDNSSGGSSDIVSPTIGQERLISLTNWLTANDRRAFLGEFGAANSKIGTGPTQIGDEAIDNMLNYIKDNEEVWLGWTWWAGGPWWGNYRFTIEPTNLGQSNETDRPSMNLLQPHFIVEAIGIPGDYNENGIVDSGDYSVWLSSLGSAEALPNDDTAGVGPDDYMRWKTAFGQTSTLTSSLESVPEPSSLCLFYFVISLACCGSRPTK